MSLITVCFSSSLYAHFCRLSLTNRKKRVIENMSHAALI